MQKDIIEALINAAVKARVRSYSPYSKFKVGAAVLVDSGKIYSGCNIENVSFGCSICAERVAIAKAVSEGYKNILAIAISGGETPIHPCGICRQTMVEFGAPDMPIICTDKEGSTYKRYDLSRLMPSAFEKF
ncbi:MAG: cytidine deaminase [Oscillospiraceae bacterium]|nr:cytidine deaminase [Oscillospiraceae bacterium]